MPVSMAGMLVRGRAARGRRSLHALKARVLLEHGLIEGGHARAGIQAKVVGQPGAQLAVAVHGLGRPAGPVQGEHVRGTEPFPERMIGHQLAELTGQQAVLAQRQPDLGLLFQRDQPLLL
jgi:hypothetical protein